MCVEQSETASEQSGPVVRVSHKVRILEFTESSKGTVLCVFPHLHRSLEPAGHHYLDLECKSLKVIWYLIQTEMVTDSLKIILEAKLSANYCEDGFWFRGPCQQNSQKSPHLYLKDLEPSLNGTRTSSTFE